MDIISLVLTIFGLVISGVAYWKADDAKKAVSSDTYFYGKATAGAV